MEEENCHFVYKHLWSPLKAPCSLGWVSPRRGEGPGTQSILQGRDLEAEGLEQWKVPLKVSSIKTVIQCACRRTTPPPLWYFCLWSANNLRSIQSIYLTLQRYCHSTLSVYRRAWTNQELLWECGSSYFLYCSLMSPSPPLERCFFFFFTALLWREHVRDKRFMWHSGILKMLITFYLYTEVKFRVL